MIKANWHSCGRRPAPAHLEWVDVGKSTPLPRIVPGACPCRDTIPEISLPTTCEFRWFEQRHVELNSQAPQEINQ